VSEAQELTVAEPTMYADHIDLGPVQFELLVHRARRLAGLGSRTILAIAGMPGAGKSTLAARLAAELGDAAALLPMDGFHLAQEVLVRLGRAQSKGAPDTFDAEGYVSTLGRLRRADEPVVYVPFFDRQVEEPIAGAIALPRDVPLIITEGNYLLLDEQPWDDGVGLVDEAWFCGLDEAERIARLVGRHRAFGKSRREAEGWAFGSDQVNAALIDSSRWRADLAFRLIEDVRA
jgi:pantothenate kinase